MVEEPTRFVGLGLKMYLGHGQMRRWAERVRTVADGLQAIETGRVEVVVLPTFPALVPVGDLLRDSRVHVGAQDLATEDLGPFTGEVSGMELAEIGCTYVEVGHAERRRLFGEDDEIVALKTAAAYRHGLRPIICVGEEVRQDLPIAIEECRRQLEASLSEARRVGTVQPLVVAYEPVWAIGAEQPAGEEHVIPVVEALRELVDADPALGGSRIIYGGSAAPGLIARLGGSVDGLFLGRAGHDPEALRTVVSELDTKRSAGR